MVYMVDYPAKRTGVLIIDPVNDFLSEGGKAYPLVEEELVKIGTVTNLRRLIEGARKRQIPLFFAPMAYPEEDYTTWRHLSGIHQAMYDNRMFEAGSWGADFHPDLQPQAGEFVILPHKNIDVFATTDLDTQLRQHDVEYAVIAGMAANVCVESTLRAGMERGYHVTAIKDATAAVGGMEAYEAAVKFDYPLICHAVSTAAEFLEEFDKSTVAAM